MFVYLFILDCVVFSHCCMCFLVAASSLSMCVQAYCNGLPCCRGQALRHMAPVFVLGLWAEGSIVAHRLAVQGMGSSAQIKPKVSPHQQTDSHCWATREASSCLNCRKWAQVENQDYSSEMKTWGSRLEVNPGLLTLYMWGLVSILVWNPRKSPHKTGLRMFQMPVRQAPHASFYPQHAEPSSNACWVTIMFQRMAKHASPRGAKTSWKNKPGKCE